MGATKNHIHTENRVAMAQLFKALAHPARLAIVDNLLIHGNLNCKDLGQLIDLAQSTISNHIKELHRAGILDVEVIGNNAYYNVNGPTLDQIADYLHEINVKLIGRKERLFNFSWPAVKVQLPYFKSTA